MEEWISLASNSSRVKIHYSKSGISSRFDSIFTPEKKWSLSDVALPKPTDRVKIHSIF